jgi:hypothetical protein
VSKYTRLVLTSIDPFYLDGKLSFNGDEEALGTFYRRKRASRMSERTIGVSHQIVNDKNKSKRQFFSSVLITDRNH